MDSQANNQKGAFRSLQWQTMSAQVRSQLQAVADEEDDPFLRAFNDEQLTAPFVPDSVSVNEEFLGLLRAVAEIEHALMVQYLYAWFTSGISVFRKVAIQEMGHLFSAQNLLRCLNQPVHLKLPEPSMPSAQEAFPFPLVLASASRQSLAQYVTAESPLAATLAEPAQAQARAAAAEALIRVRHVGLLFLKLYWLSQPDKSRFGPWDPPLTERWEMALGSRHMVFSPLHTELQRSWKTSWDVLMDDPDFLAKSADKLFVARLTTEQEPASMQCCRLFYAIGSQGEGFIDSPLQSHFELFLKLYNEWDTSPKDLIVTVTNPWIGPPSDKPELEETRLTHPASIALATAFNLRYERILLLIALTFTEEAKSDPILELIIEQAVGINGEMQASLVSIGDELVKLPAKEGGGIEALKAGPPFQTPVIPTQYADIRSRLVSLKQETIALEWPGGVALVDTEALDQALLDILPN